MHIKYHYICLTTGCTAVQPCCNGHQRIQWDDPTFGPPCTLNPLTDGNQNWQEYLGWGPTSTYQIWLKSVHWESLHNGVTYNTFVLFKPSLSFPSLSYFILAHLHSLNGLTDYHA